MRKKAQVHMLPTDTYSLGIVCKRHAITYPEIEAHHPIGKLIVNGNPDASSFEDWQPQHLYLTIDEEAKEGDWVLFRANGKEDGEWVVHQCRVDGQSFKIQRKIIASTDPKIRISENYKTVRESDHMSKISKPIPQLTEEFIIKYCVSGGFDEVIVEYKEWWSFNPKYPNEWRLEVDKEDKVILQYIHDKVEISMEKLKEAFAYYSGIGDHYISNSELEDDFYEWIKEII